MGNLARTKGALVVFLCAIIICAMSISVATTAPVRVLKQANSSPDDAPMPLALAKMAEILERKSNGALKMEIFSNSQLGTARECLESVQSGVIDITSQTLAAMGGFTDAGLIFDLPYLFKTEEDAERILDGPIGQTILKNMESAGFVGLGWYSQGWRHLTTTKKEVHAPSDMVGLKIRVMENPLHIAHFKALGASPIPMAYSEVLTSLQQGVIDGQENPYVNIKLSGLYEVQKYVIETAHIYDPIPLVISKVVWDSMSADEQKWTLEAAEEGKIYERELTRKMDAEIKGEFQKGGRNVVIELTPDERAAFRQAVESVYQEWGPRFGDVLQQILKSQE
ncbi:ABC transporter substrate-binding protein [Synergistales bacterium]|nr:ABC transporter substrate-binding protein [Synergistales bacterium]